MLKKTTNSKKPIMRPIDINALEKMRQPGYRYVSRVLSPKANPVDKAKYEIQQKILRYKRENSLTGKDLKEIFHLKQEQLDYLLFAHLEHFTLEEMVNFANSLFAPFELKIVRPGEEIHSAKHL